MVHAQDTVTTLYLAIFMSSFICGHIMKLPSTWISVTGAIKEAYWSSTL
jgi:hypothetical protein